jgi:hypothetical protein
MSGRGGDEDRGAGAVPRLAHVTFTAYDSVREKVNGILALEIMGFAILMAITFYLLSRRAWSRSASLQRESAELRMLNARCNARSPSARRCRKTWRWPNRRWRNPPSWPPGRDVGRRQP